MESRENHTRESKFDSFFLISSTKGWPCTCRRLWSDNTTTATCHSRYMLTVPRPRNVAKLRELKIEGNEIKTIGVDDLPDTLMVSNYLNKIRYL